MRNLKNKLALSITIILISFVFTGPLYAVCANITGDASIDAACCVDPVNLSYANSAGEATHLAYMNCVADAADEQLAFGDNPPAPGERVLSMIYASESNVNK